MNVGQEDARWSERKHHRAPHRRERKGRLFKRSREQLEQTNEQRLLRGLVEFCRESQEPFDQRIESLVGRLQEFFQDDFFLESIMDCILELPSKTPQYAALVGFVKLEFGDIVEKLLVYIRDNFIAALNQAAALKARMLLRFLCALVPVRVVSGNSILDLLNKIMDCVVSILDTKIDVSGRSWQPWTDNLVYIMLIALPWGGISLIAENEEKWNSFFQRVESYIQQRPIQRDATISPFLAPMKENDNPSKSDSGGPSFLLELWMAINVLRSTEQWKCRSIPVIVQDRLQQRLENSDFLVLPEFDIPTAPFGWSSASSIPERAVLLNKAFPPRGGIHLLDAQHTHPNASEIERIVVEEYILDTLAIYQGSRIDCVRRITHQIPSPFPIFALVAQTLFSQLLILPKPPSQPVTYSAIIINLCKIPDESWSVFPRGLSACVREIFSRLPVLDPELNLRMMDWLSLHLSNLSFMWPWSKWKKVVEAPVHNPQRLFVQGVLRRLVDLSYLSKVKESLSNDEFHTLLPSEPSVAPLNEVLGFQQSEDQMEIDTTIHPEQLMQRFGELSELIRKKVHFEELRSYVETMSSDLDKKDILNGLFCTILVCGDKNLTHIETIIGRYVTLLENLIQGIGEQSQAVMIEGVLKVWRNSNHRCCLVFEYLLAQQLIDPPHVIQWIFCQLSKCSIEDSVALWDVLKSALLFAESAVKTAKKQQSDAVARLQYAKESAQDAAKRAAEAAELVESGDMGHVGEMLDAINEANQSEVEAQQEVVEAEAQLESAKTYQMDKALCQFYDVIVKMFEGFAQLLKQSSEKESEAEDEGKIYYRNLCRLGSFTKQYSAESVHYMDQFQLIFAEEKVPEIVRKVAYSSLRLGLMDQEHEIIFDISFFSKK